MDANGIATDKPALLAKFRRFFLDTALSSGPSAPPGLKAFADPTRILFGSDFPYAPGGIAKYFTALFDDSPLLSPAKRSAIARSDAESLSALAIAVPILNAHVQALAMRSKKHQAAFWPRAIKRSRW